MTMFALLPWMAAYDSFNYSRHMSVYWSVMSSLDSEKESFLSQGMFASSMTGSPFTALPHDQWIEMTMNKGSKMKGGWIGITVNENALHVNTKIVNTVVKLKETLKQIAGFG